jgi:hypothetical protein
MAAKISAATERALARVKAGETAYAAAKAEGIALSTIYRALRKPGAANYAYDVGAVFGAICARHGDQITATAMGHISMRPDLIRIYLRHLDLSDFDIPAKPPGWRPRGTASSSFWLGYYHYSR